MRRIQVVIIRLCSISPYQFLLLFITQRVRGGGAGGGLLGQGPLSHRIAEGLFVDVCEE